MEKKNILVLVADYPRPDGHLSMMYVHVRNKYYSQNGLSVTVINFAAPTNYFIDGIPVITLNSFKFKKKAYDILICHAPNIRKHYYFLKAYQRYFSKIVFFFHGHEVLKLNHEYPEPYNFMKDSVLIEFIKYNFQGIYDMFKLRIWHKYFISVAEKSHFIFVSNCIYQKFLYYTKIKNKQIPYRHVIHNSVGKLFENENYDCNGEKEFDFITIRSALDNSTYCIDIINKLAFANPKYKFLVIGQGNFFKENAKPDNLIWINNLLNHDEILYYVSKSKCGLMPTRLDTQGVMSCELATYGIPLITSDLKVCREIFKEFENVKFIKNNEKNIPIDLLIKQLTEKLPYKKNNKFFFTNTVLREIDLLKNL